MPQSTITVQVGQCGNQLSSSIFSYLSPSAPPSFFRTTPKGGLVPRAVLVDTEPKVVERCLERKSNESFRYDKKSAVVAGDGGGAGNNWARGYSLYNTSTSVSTPILNSIRRELEASDHPTSLNILHSLAGGTGSGLGCAVTEGCKELFGSKSIILNTIVAPFEEGEVIVQDYNSALTLGCLLEHSDGVVVMDNGVAVRKCKTMLRLERPKMSDVNGLMGEVLAATLLPSYRTREEESCDRGEGAAEMITHCVPHHGFKLLNVTNVPTVPGGSKAFERNSWENGVVGRLRQMLREGKDIEGDTRWGREGREDVQKSIANMLILRGDGGLPPLATTPHTLFNPKPSPHLPLSPTKSNNKSLPKPPTARSDDVWKIDTSTFSPSQCPYAAFTTVSPTASPFVTTRSCGNFNGHEKHGTLVSNSPLPALRVLRRVEGAIRKHRVGAYLHQYEKYGVGEGEWDEVWTNCSQGIYNYENL